MTTRVAINPFTNVLCYLQLNAQLLQQLSNLQADYNTLKSEDTQFKQLIAERFHITPYSHL